MILRLALSTGNRVSTRYTTSSSTTNYHRGAILCRSWSSKNNNTWNWNDITTSSSSSASTTDTTTTSSSFFANNNSSTSNNEGGSKKNANKNAEILKRCSELYASLMPINDKVHGPLEQQMERPGSTTSNNTEDETVYNTIIGNNTLLPFVFLVGNHSSGKSSFINYVLGRNVQTSGVAPTDDCFTVITSGKHDKDQDGPALIFGNPELGFAPLKQFGPNLIHHTQLKVRTDIAAGDFMMVDSPGMIDSPANTYGMANTTSGGNTSSMDRGYDFQGVVRWFAERADIVLLFFDPDKPGTTGESLSILLHSLAGMDHKLLIVLNKADQFKLIHDFARAYGSLCWNLSKVIPRKDLPRIYTMCLPVDDNPNEPPAANNAGGGGGGLADLHSTRDDVVAEVMKAPQRRIDNIITHLYDSVSLLEMHTKICQDLRQRYRKLYWECKYQELGWFSTTMGLTIGSTYVLPDPTTVIVGGLLGLCITGTGGITWYNSVRLRDLERDYLSQEGLSLTFQRCFRREINEGDEFVASLWQRLRDPLRASLLEQQSLKAIASISDSEMKLMKQMMEQDIPALRRMVSPTTS